MIARRLTRGARIEILTLAGFCKTTLAIQALVKDLNAVWQFAVIVAFFISRYAALQGWRHGVHSRSLGGTEIGKSDKKWEEMPSRMLGIFFVGFWIHAPKTCQFLRPSGRESSWCNCPGSGPLLRAATRCGMI
jgi:hypothetical protein